MQSFTHLHTHTQYSLLDGAAGLDALFDRAKSLGMNALAITDHGNMFGVPQFVKKAKSSGIKPIIGCECYIAADRHNRNDKLRYHQILLAKNEIGYRNLSRLCSLGFLEGFYYKPRIDRELIKQYSKGLIATTCCIGSEVCQAILKQSESAGEACFLEWLDIFGKDYYIELQRHGIPEQDQCNAILMKWAKKHNVQVIATNDVHYVDENDSYAHDILLCLQTGKVYSDAKRMRFEKKQFFLKSSEEMSQLFSDIPEAISNTELITDSVESISLERDILLPIFPIPQGFTSQDIYLEHLTLIGAKKRYGTLSEDLETRIRYELGVIKDMGFSGYFLIVQDFIQAAKSLKVLVGPGRGSAVGSVVAYCTYITNVEPIKYKLPFERFLNPKRVSMPDFDIDFDDIGRQKVIDYVVDKYGRNQVAQVITFGSMGAKSAIRDVARVLSLPLSKADYMAKLVPDQLGICLSKAIQDVPELSVLWKDNTTPEGRVLNIAVTMEGSIRHTGIHATGVIIAPDDLINHLPVKSDKQSDLLVTQYDGSAIESVGMLKIDFLGLKTLSIIKYALELIKKNHSIVIDIDTIPLDDEKTFALYQRGDTIATFQFESEGIRQCLVQLKPSNMEDIIALNALYRPGPMQFIPNFIARKHCQEKITYLHPLLEPILKNTYGIMVYQEQIMETARVIAGYTLGEADILRRAMGKKKADEMSHQKQIFISGAKKHHDISTEKSESIFGAMEKFAKYGFNRSHSTAYSIISFQTSYLKAHYPSEYMAAVLTYNQGDIDKISYFMKECQHQNIKVLGPDINESGIAFDVNKSGQIRFGLSAIKGIGEGAAESIITERTRGGSFTGLFDFVERLHSKQVNKRALESLVNSGSFDQFTYHRRQYLHTTSSEVSVLEKAIKYGQQIAASKASVQQSLFSDLPNLSVDKHIDIPECEPYSILEKLSMEKDLVGFYISGHPLDRYKVELEYFCNANTQNALEKPRQTVFLGGMVSKSEKRHSKRGQQFGVITLEDYQGELEILFFGEDYLKYQHLLVAGSFVYITGQVTHHNNRLELRPRNLELLDEVRGRYGSAIVLNIALESLTLDDITGLYKCLQDYPGNVPVHVHVQDSAGIGVSFRSRSYLVALTDDFLSNLTKLGVYWKIETRVK